LCAACARIDSLEERRANTSFLLRKAEEKIRGKSKTITKMGGEIDRLKAKLRLSEQENENLAGELRALENAVLKKIIVKQALPPKETDGKEV
jgi:FtsZ-binding cell division protein ZapB